MTTNAEAAAVLAKVSLAHRRTAPKIETREGQAAYAETWARIFSRYNLELPDLIEAVERRAATESVAPEPAEIVAHARAIRSERASRENADRDTRQAFEDRRDRALESRFDALAAGWSADR
ncbi:hypothetical protein A5N78_04670 [Prescottella equi]|uniref:hypothetical protein n=1 Tax=Rhodococcus hoagii TaxID=43767 RepID=UPI000A1220F6|nr:hypothetical protein [Prescottella equi]ORL93432.1 hypothetical protein A5N78_04670 [Prescottella equi]ORM17785.1 hypothetical protein A5N70_11245 [Prescottella equi]